MKTIPASWKPSSDRDTWYNNRGSPMFFVRIEKIDGTCVRISNRNAFFHEEGGGNFYYDGKYFKNIEDIEFALNFMQGWPGAIGQMGQCVININNGKVDGQTFTDLYDLNDFINAKVDIFFVPEETDDISYSNSLQRYKGVITNYGQNILQVSLVINDYSNIKHKNIPQRIDEFNEDNSLSWTVPSASVAKVIPICFGRGFFRAYHCNTIEGSPRYFYVAYHYKDERGTRNPSLYYYDNDEKVFKFIESTDWSEYAYLSNTLYLIRFDVTDLVFYSEMFNFISPDQVVEYAGRLVSNSLINDQSKDYPPNGAYTLYNKLASGAYYKCGTCVFKREQFDLSANFDLYLCIENQFYCADPLAWWDVKYIVLGETITIDYASGYWTEDAVRHYQYVCAIPETFINAGYNPTLGDPYCFQLKLNVAPDDIDAVREILEFQAQRNANVNSLPESLYWTEIGLKQVMIKLPREMYVHENFGNNIIDEAIDFVFTNFLNISSSDIVYENFESEYKIDGQIYEEIDSYDFFCKLANEFGFIFYEDAEGKERFIDITPCDSVYEITKDDILMDDNGNLRVALELTDMEVFSSFYVDYQKNIAAGEYEASKYVTKDAHNLSYIDSSTMQLLCYNAYQDYHTEKRMSIKLDFVRDDETAERILGKLVQFYCYKRKVIKFVTTYRLMDLEIGDQVTVNVPELNCIDSTQNYYVVSRRESSTNMEIEWVLLESPWYGSGLVKTINENVAITEVVNMHIGSSVAETEAITETVVHHLEVPP